MATENIVYMASIIQKDSASHIQTLHCALWIPSEASLWSLTQSPDTERHKQIPIVLQTTQDILKPFTPQVHDSVRALGLCVSYIFSWCGPGFSSAGWKTPGISY